MNINNTARYVGKQIQANSPAILTALGVAGTIGTAYLVGKASYKTGHYQGAHERLADNLKREKMSPREIALKHWKLYLPAAGVGSATIACIIASNRISARRAAAMAAAYGLIAKDFDEYKDKAREMLGLKKADELDETRIRKSLDKFSSPAAGLLVPEGKGWFLDMTSQRLLITTMETIKGTQNELNFTIINNGDCSLNDFYSQMGMDPIKIGDLLGWDRKHKVEIKFTPVLTEDRGAVTAFEFVKGPRPNFWKDKDVDADYLSELDR